MIGKLFLFLLLAVTIQGLPQSSRFNQEDGYDGPFLSNGCPTDFDVHWLLPHESKCNKFYYCVFGELVERTCAPGTYFNPNANPGPVCDWPEKVDCAGKSVETPSSSSSSSESDEIPPGSGETLPNGCPADFDVHQLLPHETYCNKFYYCVFGEKVERTCAPGTYFNPDAVPGPVCDWPEHVDCAGRSAESSGSVESVSSSSSSESVEIPPGPGETLPNGCPADFDVHQLLPHETYCNKFYYCVFGEKVERTCAPGTYFNPNADPGPVCDWPENVDCAGRSAESAESSESVEPASSSSSSSSSESDEIPPGPGETLPNGCPADFDIHKLLPHETYCHKFYYCVFGEKVERTCPPGTYFNPNADPGPVCDWPHNVDCDRKPPPTESTPGPTESTPGPTESTPGPTESTPGPTESTPGPTEVTPPPTEVTPPPTEVTPPPTEEPPPTCPPETTCPPPIICPTPPPEIIDPCIDECNLVPWGHETDCDKFWRCEGREAVLVTCSEGLHFNAETGLCDFICNANCVREHVQATAHFEGLKIFMPWDMVDEELRNTHHVRHESTVKKINTLLKR